MPPRKTPITKEQERVKLIRKYVNQYTDTQLARLIEQELDVECKRQNVQYLKVKYHIKRSDKLIPFRVR